MRWLWVCVVAVCLAKFADAGGETTRCKPNSTFRRDCNVCKCSINGNSFQCTKFFCRESKMASRANLVSGKQCAPGTKWKSQCNDCECSEDGNAICTVNECPGQEAEHKLRCAPDSVWKNECNSCWCTANGHAMCTRMGCHHVADMHFATTTTAGEVVTQQLNSSDIIDVDYPDVVSQHNILKRSVCKAHEVFESDCNTCKCAADGLSFQCTQNECMDKGQGVDKEVEVFMENEGEDHIERHSVCQSRATFYIGCNTCHCNFDGTDYSCTNKPCPLPDDVELFHELRITRSAAANKSIVCVANRMFVKDCNTCWCNDDGTGFFCTRKVCVLDTTDEEKPERSEERIQCWCNDDGTGFFCTRKVCVLDTTDEEKPEELKTISRQCRPDEVFEIDCNMCRCNPDGLSFSCTRRACLAEPSVPEELDSKEPSTLSRKVRAAQLEQPEAEKPKKPWSRAGRLEYLELSSRSNGSCSNCPHFETTPKQCQPSREFRIDCNTCLCDNEGQNFSCTRIDCRAQSNGNNGGVRRKREVTRQAMVQCEPGSVFEQNCNVCRCTSDGRHATCTLKRCSLKPEEDRTDEAQESDPNFRCNPGEQFRRGCNDCTCSADGKSEFCTLRLCDSEIEPSV